MGRAVVAEKERRQLCGRLDKRHVTRVWDTWITRSVAGIKEVRPSDTGRKPAFRLKGGIGGGFDGASAHAGQRGRARAHTLTSRDGWAVKIWRAGDDWRRSDYLPILATEPVVRNHRSRLLGTNRPTAEEDRREEVERTG